MKNVTPTEVKSTVITDPAAIERIREMYNDFNIGHEGLNLVMYKGNQSC